MDDQNSNLDFTEIIKLVQNMSKSQAKVDPHRMSQVDQLINNQELRVLKATLPYFDYPMQKNLAIALKFMEFKNTMDFFNAPIEVHNEKFPKKEIDKLEVLNEIRNNCDEPFQKKLNTLIMLMNFQKSSDMLKNGNKLLNTDYTEDSKETKTNSDDGYNHFMNMMNKIIKEKDGE